MVGGVTAKVASKSLEVTAAAGEKSGITSLSRTVGEKSGISASLNGMMSGFKAAAGPVAKVNSAAPFHPCALGTRDQLRSGDPRVHQARPPSLPPDYCSRRRRARARA